MTAFRRLPSAACGEQTRHGRDAGQAGCGRLAGNGKIGANDSGGGKTTTVRMLIGTTGEKQLRVTESVISAISHRAWIDGKVLEIIAYSLMSVASVAFGLLLVGVAAQFASGFVWPSAALRPTVVLMLLPHTVLGLLLWNAFFAALPATVTDMYASDRSSLMFLPIRPVVLSVAVVRDPDGQSSR